MCAVPQWIVSYVAVIVNDVAWCCQGWNCNAEFRFEYSFHLDIWIFYSYVCLQSNLHLHKLSTFSLFVLCYVIAARVWNSLLHQVIPASSLLIVKNCRRLIFPYSLPWLYIYVQCLHIASICHFGCYSLSCYLFTYLLTYKWCLLTCYRYY